MNSNNTVQLFDPTTALESEYQAYLADFAASGELDKFNRLPGDDFAAFVAQLAREARGEGLPDWAVPQNIYWVVSNGRIVGMLKLRHRLTPALENYGGNIGYAVRPSARGRGVATRMLALALEKARALGLQRVLLTCNPENLASARVMVKNGAVRAADSTNPETGMPHARYWIELKGAPA